MSHPSNSSQLQVVLASNANYFDGLAVTLLSLLRSNRSNTLSVNIIDGGLHADQKAQVRAWIQAQSVSNSVRFLTIDDSVFAGYRPDYGGSYMTYARILVASLLEHPRVVYLDSDLLVGCDLAPLWQIPLGDSIAAASQDPGVILLKNDYPFDDDCGEEKYFNAGVMVMNLEVWRKENIQRSLLELIARTPERFKWWDQSAMNALFRGRVRFVEPHWNVPADSVSVQTDDTGQILHYVGGSKPWTKYLDSTEFFLWRAFYRRYIGSPLRLLRRRSYLTSYLTSKRYNLIRRNRFLRVCTLGMVTLTSRLLRDEGRSVLQFRNRYYKEPEERGGPPITHDQLNHFVKTRWG